MGDEFQ
jgi:hypothetical protein